MTAHDDVMPHDLTDAETFGEADELDTDAISAHVRRIEARQAADRALVERVRNTPAPVDVVRDALVAMQGHAPAPAGRNAAFILDSLAADGYVVTRGPVPASTAAGAVDGAPGPCASSPLSSPGPGAPRCGHCGRAGELWHSVIDHQSFCSRSCMVLFIRERYIEDNRPPARNEGPAEGAAATARIEGTS